MIKDRIKVEGKSYKRALAKPYDCTGCAANGTKYLCHRLIEAGQECFYAVPMRDDPDYSRPSIWVEEG